MAEEVKTEGMDVDGIFKLVELSIGEGVVDGTGTCYDGQRGLALRVGYVLMDDSILGDFKMFHAGFLLPNRTAVEKFRDLFQEYLDKTATGLPEPLHNGGETSD